MQAISRFLEKFFKNRRAYALVIGVLGAASIVVLGVQAHFGSIIAVPALTLVALMWLGLSISNSNLHWGTLDRWGKTLEMWQETGNLVDDLYSLVVEACDGLSTYDREKADDILGRSTTVAIMRSQNIIAKSDKTREEDV
jgi:hypothetical protein